MLITLGAIGLLSAILEAVATAIGVGIVFGGFVGATAGLVGGWSRKDVERHALRDGYFGAVFALAWWGADLIVGYAVLPWTS
jgi:hypothetical protein